MEPGEFHRIISVNMFDGPNKVNISQVTDRYVLMYIQTSVYVTIRSLL